MFRNVSEIDAALRQLGKRLLYADSPRLMIVVCGGSGLHVLGLCSRTTRDIDVCVAMLSRESFSWADRTTSLPSVVTQAVEAVSRDIGLPPDWLNTAASEVLEIYGPPNGLIERLEIRDYGPLLRAGFLSKIDQIHFKLLAASDPKSPERHIEDLQTRLRPSAEEATLAMRWLMARPTSRWFRANVRKVLEKLGHADVAQHIQG